MPEIRSSAAKLQKSIHVHKMCPKTQDRPVSKRTLNYRKSDTSADQNCTKTVLLKSSASSKNSGKKLLFQKLP